MDEFLSNFQTVVDWIAGILGDLIDLAMEYPFMAVIIVAGIGFLVFDNILLILSGHKGSKAKTSPVKVSKLSGAGTFGVGGAGTFGLGKKNRESSLSVSMSAKSGASPAGYSSVVGGGKFTKGKPVGPKDNGHFAPTNGRISWGSRKSRKKKVDETKEHKDFVNSVRKTQEEHFYPPDPPPSNYNIDIFVD